MCAYDGNLETILCCMNMYVAHGQGGVGRDSATAALVFWPLSLFGLVRAGIGTKSGFCGPGGGHDSTVMG